MPNRYRPSNRDDYRRQDYDRRYSRQPEQFQQDDESQFGEDTYRLDERNSRQFDDEYTQGHDRQARQYRQRDYSRAGSSRVEDYDPLGEYDAAYVSRTTVYEQPEANTHTFFRPDDFGGEDYTRSRYPGGRSRASGTSGYASPKYDRYDRSQRGFFDRAGDEVASWFGDEEAARRRELDHRGRGPANYQRSDERLLEDACERLTHDRLVDARNINVTVSDNEITLDGTVDNRLAKRRAEDCVHDIAGVKHVQNNLRIVDKDDAYRTSTGSESA